MAHDSFHTFSFCSTKLLNLRQRDRDGSHLLIARQFFSSGSLSALCLVSVSVCLAVCPSVLWSFDSYYSLQLELRVVGRNPHPILWMTCRSVQWVDPNVDNIDTNVSIDVDRYIS